MYISVSKLSDELNKTIWQIQYMVKNRIAIPVNPDTHRRDGGYRFTTEELERLKKIYKRSDFSLKEAANLVGITPQYLNQLAMDNKISSQMVRIGKREERRFEENSCIVLRNELNSKTHSKRHRQYGEKLVTFYNGVRLFQQIEINGVCSRIIKTNPLVLLTENGTTIENIDNIENEMEWPEKPYITKKGFIEFQMPMPRSSNHPIYELFYILIQHIGPKNIQFFETSERDYYVRCRQANLAITQNQFELLQRFLVKGKIYIKGEVSTLSTDFEHIYIDIPGELLNSLKKEARIENTSLNTIIINKLITNMEH
jgi:hypothetical protein